jgi:Tfp pilus assembly protein PilN
MRQDLRAHVIPAAQARSSVEAMRRRVKLLCQLRDDPTRWSNVLVTIAERLPLDAYLTQLSAASDTVSLEGVALRASDALAELRAAPGIRSLHATAPIRRDANGGENHTEHFTVALRLESPKERR